jgi:hypothetical protein
MIFIQRLQNVTGAVRRSRNSTTWNREDSRLAREDRKGERDSETTAQHIAETAVVTKAVTPLVAQQAL